MKVSSLSSNILAVTLALIASAKAQGIAVENPSSGINLPENALAGQADATAVVTNPAQLSFVGPAMVNGVFELDYSDETKMPGFGLFWGQAWGSSSRARFAMGGAVEWVDAQLGLPATDDFVRMSWAMALTAGRHSSLGLAWRHTYDGGVLSGLDTFDLGISSRPSSYFGFGLVLRDMFAPEIAGIALQRRAELEFVFRPLGSDRLDIALGGRAGLTRMDFTNGQDLEAWMRLGVKLTTGLYLRGQIESQSKLLVEPGSTDSDHVRQWRMLAGLEISLGGAGLAAYSHTSKRKNVDATMSTILNVRLSSEAVPSIIGRGRHMQQVELTGNLGESEVVRLIARLRRLRDDDNVSAVIVKFDSPGAGWGTINEIRSELVGLRRAGKRVLALLVAGSTRDYYIASAADAILVDPAGGIRLQGMAGESMYFKGLFDQLGVVAQFEKIEEYKSAPEQWTMTGPSPEAEMVRKQMLDSMYDHMTKEIASSRHLTVARVKELIDGGPYTGGDLKKLPELVDAVVEPDELDTVALKFLKEDAPLLPPQEARPEEWNMPNVAVIYIEGDIVDGESQVVPLLGKRMVGDKTITEAIATARARSDIKAILLRINSPGGSALASEQMAREVFKTRGVKPILCSMSDVAASGGYFAAAGCDMIFADAMTITGSIGIFNGKFDVSALLAKLGISFVISKRGARADMESFLRPFTDEERAFLKEKLRYFYGRFVQNVAKGRGMTEAQVDAVGRGRVFTGRDALGKKLVDKLGTVGDALEEALARAGIEHGTEYGLVHLPVAQNSLVSKLIGSFLRISGQTPASSLNPWGELLVPRLKEVLQAVIPGSAWLGDEVPQARLPFGWIWLD